MPADMQGCLIFHYNLKFYDSEEDSFDTVSLKRFVMQVSNYNGRVYTTRRVFKTNLNGKRVHNLINKPASLK